MFTARQYWVSDQDVHFINELLQRIAYVHNIQRKYSVAFSLLVNRTVERLNRDILAIFKATRMEFRLAFCDCSSIVEAISTVLNEGSTGRP